MMVNLCCFTLKDDEDDDNGFSKQFDRFFKFMKPLVIFTVLI